MLIDPVFPGWTNLPEIKLDSGQTILIAPNRFLGYRSSPSKVPYWKRAKEGSSSKPFIPGKEIKIRQKSYGIEGGFQDSDDGRSKIFTVRFRLPRGSSPRNEWMRINYQGIYSRQLKVKPIKLQAMIYCHILQRLIDEPAFDEAPNIPIFFGWNKIEDNAKKFLNSCIDLNSWCPSKLDLHFSAIRHKYTPYDYQWESGIEAHDAVKKYWNKRIQELYQE